MCVCEIMLTTSFVESGKINTQMDMTTIQQQLDNFLSSLQDCVSDKSISFIIY